MENGPRIVLYKWDKRKGLSKVVAILSFHETNALFTRLSPSVPRHAPPVRPAWQARPPSAPRSKRKGSRRKDEGHAALQRAAAAPPPTEEVRSFSLDRPTRRSVEKTMTRKISPLRLRRSATLRIPTQIILRFEMNFFSASLFQSSPPCSPCRPHPQIRGTGDESRARRRASQKSRIIRGKDYF